MPKNQSVVDIEFFVKNCFAW